MPHRFSFAKVDIWMEWEILYIKDKRGYSCFLLNMIISIKTVFFLPVGTSYLLAAVLNSLIVYCLLSDHFTNFLTDAWFLLNQILTEGVSVSQAGLSWVLITLFQ